MSLNLFKTAFFLIFSFGICSCSNKGVTSASDPQNTITSTEEDKIIVDNTYSIGVVTQTKEIGDCEWVIKLGDGRIFETTNLKTEFKKDGNTVNFKYRGLRKLSKCKGATPVEITEINTNM